MEPNRRKTEQKREQGFVCNCFRCIWRHTNFAFAIYIGFCIQKKHHHICEENYSDNTSHQNSHSTITSLQSTVFMMNVLSFLQTIYRPGPFLLLPRENIYLQGKLSSFKTEVNEQQKSCLHISKKRNQENSVLLRNLLVILRPCNIHQSCG